MSTKSVSKKISFRAVSKVARKLSFRTPKPLKRSAEATEELETLTRSTSCRLLPASLSNLADLQQQQQPVEETEEVPEPEPKEVDPEVEAAKLRVARRFFLKRTERFSGIQGYLLQCPLSDRGRIIKSLLNIRDSVRSTISHALPKTKTFTKMTSTMVNTLTGYLGLASRSNSERGLKRKRSYEANCEKTNLTTYMNGLNLSSRPGTAKKKDCEDNVEFAKPRVYDCEYCIDKKFFHHSLYFKHMRRHKLKDIVRCRGCNVKFNLKRDNINDMRRHEVNCTPRVPLK